MKKNSISQSAFFNWRILIGFVLCATGISMALAGFGQNRWDEPHPNRPSVVSNATDSPDATPTPTVPPCPAIFAYISNENDNDVSVIDTSDNTVVATVGVGSLPFGVAVKPDGTRAYVTNNGSSSVSVIDTSTNTVVATVGVGSAPSEVAVKPDGTRAYVTNSSSNNISVIDTSNNTVVATMGVGSGPKGCRWQAEPSASSATRSSLASASA